jgi:hypothetical protein
MKRNKGLLILSSSTTLLKVKDVMSREHNMNANQY